LKSVCTNQSMPGPLRISGTHTFLTPTTTKTVSQIRPIRPRIADPGILISGSTGNDVHANGKNVVLPLFFKTGQK
jgi:hypothetical protein